MNTTDKIIILLGVITWLTKAVLGAEGILFGGMYGEKLLGFEKLKNLPGNYQ